MEVCIFRNIMAKYPQGTSLDNIVRIMRSSKRLESICKRYKEAKEMDDKAMADRIKKRELPVFAPAAMMFEGKSRNNIIGLTDLCFIDIDHIDEEQISKAMCFLQDDPHTVFASRSVSGKGLHILIRYALDNLEEHPDIMNMTTKRMNLIYSSVFKTIKGHYSDHLGLTVDKSGMNMERLCLVSYDPELYYNPEAKALHLEYKHMRMTRYPKRLNITQETDTTSDTK